MTTDANKSAWSEVDEYLSRALLVHDAQSASILKANHDAGLPAIDVSPNQAKFLYLIASMIGAKNILEFGTLGGFSTIWMARALPAGGRIITMEASVAHAEVAKRNFAVAGVTDMVDLRVGPALDTLPMIEANLGEPFDLVFIDADKPNNPTYLDWAINLTRPGSIIIVDNIVRGGRVLDADSQDPAVNGTRSFLELVGRDPRLEAAALQTVGVKGWDGLVIARKL